MLDNANVKINRSSVNIYTPGFVNVSSGIGTDLSFTCYLLPVGILNVSLSPPISFILIG